MFIGEFKLLCDVCRTAYLITAATETETAAAVDLALVRGQAARQGWLCYPPWGIGDFCPDCRRNQPALAAVQNGGAE